MKALTLWQPYASLAIAGIKKYETRPWATSYRGPLAIHAAKLRDDELIDRIGLPEFNRLDAICCDHGLGHIYSVPRGVVLGTVELVDCGRISPVHDTIVNDQGFSCGRITSVERSLGDYTPGRYAWQLANPTRFEMPIPARGQQGLWNWDECSACTFESRVIDCDICPMFPASADVPMWTVCSGVCEGCVDQGECPEAEK